MSEGDTSIPDTVVLKHPAYAVALVYVAVLLFFVLSLIFLKQLILSTNYESFFSSLLALGLTFLCLYAGIQRLFFLKPIKILDDGVCGFFVKNSLTSLPVLFKLGFVSWQDIDSIESMNSLELEGSVLRESSGYEILRLKCKVGDLLIFKKLRGFDFLLSKLKSHRIEIHKK